MGQYLSHCSISMTLHHDQANSYTRKCLIVVLQFRILVCYHHGVSMVEIHDTRAVAENYILISS